MTDVALCEPATPAEIEGLDGWLAERKIDGVRMLAKEGRLLTRSGRDVTASFPEIDPPEHHTLDGEVVTNDFRFDTTLQRVQTEKPFKVDVLAEVHPASLIVFDAITVNGGDVTDEPLVERKEKMEGCIPAESGLIPISACSDTVGAWENAQSKGWEGIILKDPDAAYHGERSDRWLKIKDWEEETFPIKDCERTDNDGFVIYVDVGTDELQKVAVNAQTDQANVQKADEAQVQYLERTDANRLRKPSFRGVA
jgi:ATP-dependent DNA ligase